MWILTKDSGTTRLRDQGLKKVFEEFMQFSATLGNDVEFSVFWNSIFDRMEHDRCSTDHDGHLRGGLLVIFIRTYAANLVACIAESSAGHNSNCKFFHQRTT